MRCLARSLLQWRTSKVVKQSQASWSSMRKSISFGKFVFVCLVCYFGYILIRAHHKLQSRNIGTMFKTVSEKTVQESSLFSSLVVEYNSTFQTTSLCLYHVVDEENRESFTCLVPTSNGMHIHWVSVIRSSDIWSFWLYGQFLVGPDFPIPKFFGYMVKFLIYSVV